MRTRPTTVAAAALLMTCLLVGCSEPEGVAVPTEPTSTTAATSTTAPATDDSTVEDEPTVTVEPTVEDEPTVEVEVAAGGPQTCGTVTSVVGQQVTVEIVVGDVACAFAENLLDTYYNDPPSPPEGSGGYLVIGDWECNSSSSQEPGRASTCHGPDDGLVVAVPAGGDNDPQPGPVCSQIDRPTLDQIFPEGGFDEARCQSYIDGENAIG